VTLPELLLAWLPYSERFGDMAPIVDGALSRPEGWDSESFVLSTDMASRGVYADLTFLSADPAAASGRHSIKAVYLFLAAADGDGKGNAVGLFRPSETLSLAVSSEDGLDYEDLELRMDKGSLKEACMVSLHGGSLSFTRYSATLEVIETRTLAYSGDKGRIHGPSWFLPSIEACGRGPVRMGACSFNGPAVVEEETRMEEGGKTIVCRRFPRGEKPKEECRFSLDDSGMVSGVAFPGGFVLERGQLRAVLDAHGALEIERGLTRIAHRATTVIPGPEEAEGLGNLEPMDYLLAFPARELDEREWREYIDRGSYAFRGGNWYYMARFPSTAFSAPSQALLASYSRPGEKIESTAPEIKSAAEEACEWITTDDAKISAIVAWVYGHIKPADDMASLDALETLMTRRGNCTCCANLACAMLRSVGIPAIPISGLELVSDGAYGYHSWVAAWVDGGWKQLDPTKGCMDQREFITYIPNPFSDSPIMGVTVTRPK
jgi:hypothetical protein